MASHNIFIMSPLNPWCCQEALSSWKDNIKLRAAQADKKRVPQVNSVLGWERRCWGGRGTLSSGFTVLGWLSTHSMPSVSQGLAQGLDPGLGAQGRTHPSIPTTCKDQTVLAAGVSPEVPAGITWTSHSVLARLSRVTAGKHPHWKRLQHTPTNQVGILEMLRTTKNSL